MLVAIHQPNLLPRLRVFAKIWASDRLVVLDNVQFSTQAWQNRFLVSSFDSVIRRTFPVSRPSGRDTHICDVGLVQSAEAKRATLATMDRVYARTKFRDEAMQLFAKGIDENQCDFTQASCQFLESILSELGRPLAFELASRLPIDSRDRSLRLYQLAASVGGDRMIVGPGGLRYLDLQLQEPTGIRIVTQAWHSATTTRLHPHADPNMSILDALAIFGARDLRGFLDTLASELQECGNVQF